MPNAKATSTCGSLTTGMVQVKLNSLRKERLDDALLLSCRFIILI